MRKRTVWRVTQPDKIRNHTELQERVRALAPDAIVIVAYGRLIPPWMLALPKHGNLNVHASLLPKYRGAAPIQWAVANGETETGITTMRIDEGLDPGDTLLQERLPILSAANFSGAVSGAGGSGRKSDGAHLWLGWS